MPLVNFSDVDFDQIKESIKDYLRANSNFTDYDFEGSNLSTIIDTLAYNTYITSYNANMVTNEVFLDSATLRENAVSLARNVGYVPRSRKAAVANISFFVNLSNSTATSLTLKAGLVAVTSRQKNGNALLFSIPQDITVPVDSTGVAYFNNINIFEGTYVLQTFTYRSRNPNQRYILTNTGIDTDLLYVTVNESEQSSVSRKYSQFNSLVQVESNSAIYYLQETEGERYELLFGDGIFGEKLQEPNFIKASYIISNGVDGNNVDKFSYSGTLVTNNGGSVTSGVSVIATNTPSYGGAEIESVESVKKYAPAIYASQNRAVTSSDYEAIVSTVFPETQSVTAFGGEDLNPPAFGKVFISIKPQNGVYLSNNVKDNIKNQLRRYSVAGIITEIVDLKYIYVEVNSSVYYNSNSAPSPQYVKTVVDNNITNYANSSQLNRFGARFKYSKFLKIVDDSHESITSNITTVAMRRDMVPELNKFTEYEVCYGNRFHIKNHSQSATLDGTVIGYNIRSSGFKVSGISDTVYLGDKPTGDNTSGTIFLFKLSSPSEPVILKRNIGVIDYVKGEIKLNPINILSTDIVKNDNPVVEISVQPYSNDVIGLQDLYLQLDLSYTNINMVSDNISSGNDQSGSNYLVSSSYGTTSLVRGTPIISTTGSTNTNTTTQNTTATRTATQNTTPTSVVNTNTTTTTSGGSSSSY